MGWISLEIKSPLWWSSLLSPFFLNTKPWHNLRLFSFVPSLVTPEKRPTPTGLHPPEAICEDPGFASQPAVAASQGKEKHQKRSPVSKRNQRSPKAAPRAWRSSFHQPKARNKPMCKVQPPSQAVPTPHKPFWRQASKCPMRVPQRNQHPKTCRTSLSLPASTEAHPSPGPAAQKGTMFQLWSNSQQLTQCSFSKAY